ncbi:pyridoxamine 5'-phosphate oxidase family protein [Duganella sp. LX20W]|uniref:Pyridoxamine 5'-phosphate oxidase family protein n=1 Tax=Rugamonas brunnea TaxID=2758569 RepID=A0A7W2ERH3_9BURK|nr:pyridoxamine 5'-phosphate oxidase family protein [Rugamonas brunnea]MBA5637313.1 pyridoxamine 5'-phosphate oxidase family protein [Rugamonas brunnea]
MKDTAAPVPPSDRTRVRRGAEKAHYDEATLHAIVDDAYLCHIAFSDEHGAHCIPTASWRSGGHLYIHGSNGSRLLKQLVRQTCCVTISHLDGLVLARSAFSHTMNYRSAMVYGRFEAVEDDAGKHAALEALMDKLAPGRQAEIRPGNDKEYAATTVLRISLAEAACKVRAGGPNDDEEDLGWPAWAGVLPFARARTTPVADPACTVAAPAYVRDWQTPDAALAPIY